MKTRIAVAAALLLALMLSAVWVLHDQSPRDPARNVRGASEPELSTLPAQPSPAPTHAPEPDAELVRPANMDSLDQAPPPQEGDDGEISGTVLDEGGSAVAGVRIYAVWGRAESQGKELPHWMAEILGAGLRSGRAEPYLGRVWWRSTLTDSIGRYKIGKLPHRSLHLYATHSAYLIGAFGHRVAEPGAVMDWHAQRVFPVEIAVQYPDDTPLPHTTCGFMNRYSSISGSISSDGRIVRLGLPAGSHDVGIENDAYGLKPDDSRIDVEPSSRVQKFTIVLQRRPFPRVRVAFEGPTLTSEYELRWCKPELGSQDSPEVQLLRGEFMKGDSRSGLHFRENEEPGPWWCGLVCDRTCVAWTDFDSARFDIDLELRVPSPDLRTCCRVTTNRDVVGKLVAAWQDTQSLMWRESARVWLVQPQAEINPNARKLHVYAPNLGRLAVPHNGKPGGDLQVEFARPARVLVEVPEVLPHETHIYAPAIIFSDNKRRAVELGPLGYELIFQPAELRLWIRPGVYQVTWDAGGDHTPLPPVKFAVTSDEILVLTGNGMTREQP